MAETILLAGLTGFISGLLLSVRGGTVLTTVNANYTLSHCYGAPEGGGGSTTNVSVGYNIPSNPRFDDRNCAADRLHTQRNRRSGPNRARRAPNAPRTAATPAAYRRRPNIPSPILPLSLVLSFFLAAAKR